MKRWVYIVLTTALLVGINGSVGWATIISTFDTDAEGWTVANDAYPIVYHANGGNPGGFISAQDKGWGQT